MRRIIFFIVAIFIACCSVNAQNATITGPKKSKASATTPKLRTTQRKKKANRSLQRGATEQSTFISSPTGYSNGHGYVDLGLSVKWATCNVGASAPEYDGNYYAWGEVSTKYNYSWDNYTYKNTNIGSNIMGTYYDVAHVKWGGNWRAPSKAECEELVNRCLWTWTTKSGHKGYKVRGPNGNSIFLPAAGYYIGTSINYAGAGSYWSSTVYNDYYSYGIYFFSSKRNVDNGSRGLGQSVRAVIE